MSGSAKRGQPGRASKSKSASKAPGASGRNGRAQKTFARLLYNEAKGYYYGTRPQPSGKKGPSESQSFGSDYERAVDRFRYWKDYKPHPGLIEIGPLVEPLAERGMPRRSNALRLLAFWGDLIADDIDAASCQLYIHWCRKQPSAHVEELADSTIRQDLKILHAIVGAACADIDETYKVNVILPGEGPPREAFFFANDLARFICAMRGRLRDKNAADGWLRDKNGRLVLCQNPWRLFAGRLLARFVMLTLYTASRRGVVEAARWGRGSGHGHFDRDEGVFYRKGRGEVRGNKRALPVTLSPLLQLLLDGWHKRDLADWPKRLPAVREKALGALFTDKLKNILRLAPDERVMVTLDPSVGDEFDKELGIRFELSSVIDAGEGAPLKIDRWWALFREEAGLRDTLVPHSLRKTMAIWLVAAGAADDRVAEFLSVSLPILSQYYLIADVALTDPIANAIDRCVFDPLVGNGLRRHRKAPGRQMGPEIRLLLGPRVRNARNRRLNQLIEAQPPEGEIAPEENGSE